ncbi:hypothetical protein [Neobacillus cucumis]|uniref:hypothetical protein n=1 Tax=Neobacillus cucumis TaxID=1740721 RepID=UPI002E1EC198|nr:hypothetical protein [Neobacillus cucumis]
MLNPDKTTDFKRLLFYNNNSQGQEGNPFFKNTTTLVGGKVTFYEKLAQKTKKEMDKEWFSQ